LNISLERAVDYLKIKGLLLKKSNTKFLMMYTMLCRSIAGDRGKRGFRSRRERKEKEAFTERKKLKKANTTKKFCSKKL
jgi:hypothetical protein